MSAGTPPPDLPEPGQFKKVYGEWYNLIQAIAAVVVSALGVLLTGIFGATFNDQHQILVKVVGYVVTLAIVAGGVWLWRARAPRPVPIPPVIRPSSTAVFRGLYAFSEDDPFDLPGAERQTEAATVSTQVQSPGFKFGLISGETGCGKSSFLASGVLRRLRAAQIPVEIVRSPRALLNRVGPPPEGEQPGLTQLADAVGSAPASCHRPGRQGGSLSCRGRGAPHRPVRGVLHRLPVPGPAPRPRPSSG